MKSIRSLISVAAAAGALTVTAAACGSSGTSTGSAAPSTARGAGGGSSSALIKTAANPGLGTILVDGQGRTLYRFDADTGNPPSSHCNGSCATYWPPLRAGSGPEQVQGVSSAMLGTVTRADGTKQVTLDGWPLYTYAADTAAGDTNGQDLNASGGLWWAVTPSGARAHAMTSPSPSSTHTGVGGY